jgi:hypothetical protein
MLPPLQENFSRMLSRRQVCRTPDARGGLALVLNQANRIAGRPECRLHPHEMGEGMRLHLLHNLPAVGLHCDFADAQLGASLFVQQAGDHQCHDLSFSQRE